ncbi:UbiX family flavin prenyltransferase [uncultured Fibrobacter sp.]|uniref:UbiX family flavin prenyltransferase n=1 Tax=uncultured Fibrobacter sp. TaxID=261512 RepID=UPI0025CF76D2|nr:UbiX family flavin prenyltransferase [uncultured Fibrobacter sp.]
MSRYILGVTGASGAIYATRTAMHLKRLGHDVSLIVTAPGREVVEYEGQKALFDLADKTFDVDDFFAECASGSADYAGMAVVPCSMGTLGRIAAGTSDNLLVRTADVCLKERRALVIVPREMPYNLIHIENMARVTRAGAIVVPASPQFYSWPASIEELVDTVVAKILMHLGAASGEECAGIVKPWNGGSPECGMPAGCGPENALGGPIC